MGRFLNADGQINDGFIANNLFAYCENNPVNKVDYYGLDPGDLFDTVDDAAIDAANYINAKSISENREYASAIYKVNTIEKVPYYVNIKILNFSINIKSTKYIKKTKYTYTEPKKGFSDASIVSKAPLFKKRVAIFHTHSAYDAAMIMMFFQLVI